MTLQCDPCVCHTPYTGDKESFMYAVVTLLCSIITNTDPTTPPVLPVLTEADFEDAVEIASAAIGAGYALATTLSEAKTVVFDNSTDGDVWVSMDAGVGNTYHVPSGRSHVLNLAEAGVKSSAVVHVKDGVVASSNGSFYIYSYK